MREKKLDFSLFCTLCCLPVCFSAWPLLHLFRSVPKILVFRVFFTLSHYLGSSILCCRVSRFLFPLSHKSFPLLTFSNNLYNTNPSSKTWLFSGILCAKMQTNQAGRAPTYTWRDDRSPMPSHGIFQGCTGHGDTWARAGRRWISPEDLPSPKLSTILCFHVLEPQTAILVSTESDARGKSLQWEY